MIPAYVLMASDKWFRFDEYAEDNKGEQIYWYKSPKRMAVHDRVFVYLAGGSKAIKYEGVITQSEGLTMSNTFRSSGQKSYLVEEEANFDTEKFGDQAVIGFKITKVFTNLEETSIKNMKEHGVRGMFMSNRELKPQTIMWLDTIKSKKDFK